MNSKNLISGILKPELLNHLISEHHFTMKLASHNGDRDFSETQGTFSAKSYGLVQLV